MMHETDPDTPQSGQILLFGIGAQKAGTTWLQSQLARLDTTFFARPKELHYWDCIRAPYLDQYKLRARQRLHVPTAEDPLRYRMSRHWNAELKARVALAVRYEAVYAASPYDHRAYTDYAGVGRAGAKLVGDITPSYALLDRATFAEMLGCAEDVRFVFMMRDPVQRLWSGLQQRHRTDLKNGRMSDADLERRFDTVCDTPGDPDFYRSDYMRTMSELEAAVPAARIHYCFFETLMAGEDGQEARNALARFLQVEESCLDARDKVHTNAAKRELGAARTRSARHSLEPVYSALHDRFGAQIPSEWLA